MGESNVEAGITSTATQLREIVSSVNTSSVPDTLELLQVKSISFSSDIHSQSIFTFAGAVRSAGGFNSTVAVRHVLIFNAGGGNFGTTSLATESFTVVAY